MPAKIYVVSLGRAVERRSLMKKQLEEIGLPYEFIDAHDARSITDEDVSAINSQKSYFKDLSKGEIACVMSHAKACKALFDDPGFEYGLVVEDDVILSLNLSKILDALEVVHSSDSITLLCALVYEPVVFRKQQDLILDYSIVKSNNLDGVYGAQAYFLQSSKASEFFKNLLPVKIISDDWKSHMENNYFSQIKFVYPFPVQHAEFLSAVNEKVISGEVGFRTRIKSMIYYKKIFPFYQLFIWLRRRSAEKIQRKNITASGFYFKKTYKL